MHSGANLLGDGFGGGGVELPAEVQEGQHGWCCPLPKPDLDRSCERYWRSLWSEKGLTPSWARPQLDPLPPKRGSDGRVGDIKTGTEPRK